MTDCENTIADQNNVETSAMSASLMDETNTNKAVANKTKFGVNKLKAAVGVGVLATGILTGCVVSSMRKNPTVVSL